MTQDRKICVGIFSGAHGVKGLVRLKSFTEEPDSIKLYKPLTDESGKRSFTVDIKSSTNDHFIAEVEGVKNREAAEALRGTKLFAPRAALPKLKKREFYESDLVGLAARNAKGENCGKVIAVHNYGCGPFLEIAPPEGGAFMLPFTKTSVPEVNIEEGHIVVAPPEGWFETQKPNKKTKKPLP